MKIKLASTLPFTPVHRASSACPRRAVGQLMGTENGRDFLIPVYEYKYTEDDKVLYRIDPQERLHVDQAHDLPAIAANQSKRDSEYALVWVEHEDHLEYKPYAFLIMDALTKMIGAWDGVVYRTPSGERLRESAWHTTLQVVDACVCTQTGLWAMVQLSVEPQEEHGGDGVELTQLGWVPLAG